DLRLAAKLAFGADFARDARHFRGKRVELVDHRIDGVLQFENFALHVDGDLARQVTARDGGGDFGDVADLCGEVCRQQVDVVGQIFPGTGDARHVGLATEAAFSADFARHARHFAGKRPQLVGRRIERFLQLQKFATNVDGDLLGKVAVGDGCGHFGDVADLSGQVRSHEVDVVGEVLPCACHFRH